MDILEFNKLNVILKEGGLVLDTGDSDILKGIEEGRALNNLDRLRQDSVLNAHFIYIFEYEKI